jgi:hypothetical protein
MKIKMKQYWFIVKTACSKYSVAATAINAEVARTCLGEAYGPDNVAAEPHMITKAHSCYEEMDCTERSIEWFKANQANAFI